MGVSRARVGQVRTAPRASNPEQASETARKAPVRGQASSDSRKDSTVETKVRFALRAGAQAYAPSRASGEGERRGLPVDCGAR
jgi:hypothetical protein